MQKRRHRATLAGAIKMSHYFMPTHVRVLRRTLPVRTTGAGEEAEAEAEAGTDFKDAEKRPKTSPAK